jgi:hypothetical protein
MNNILYLRQRKSPFQGVWASTGADNKKINFKKYH